MGLLQSLHALVLAVPLRRLPPQFDRPITAACRDRVPRVCPANVPHSVPVPLEDCQDAGLRRGRRRPTGRRTRHPSVTDSSFTIGWTKVPSRAGRWLSRSGSPGGRGSGARRESKSMSDCLFVVSLVQVLCVRRRYEASVGAQRVEGRKGLILPPCAAPSREDITSLDRHHHRAVLATPLASAAFDTRVSSTFLEKKVAWKFPFFFFRTKNPPTALLSREGQIRRILDHFKGGRGRARRR